MIASGGDIFYYNIKKNYCSLLDTTMLGATLSQPKNSIQNYVSGPIGEFDVAVLWHARSPKEATALLIFERGILKTIISGARGIAFEPRNETENFIVLYEEGLEIYRSRKEREK